MQTPDIGGAETYMHSLITQFVKKQHGVTLVTNLDRYIAMFDQKKISVEKMRYELDIIGDWKGFIKTLLVLPLAALFYIRLLRSFQRKKIDVILMSNFSEKLLVTFLTLFIRIPVVWIEYGPLESVLNKHLSIPKILYRFLNKVPKSVIVPTKNTKNHLLSHAKVSLSKFAVIPCGVDLPKKTSRDPLLVKKLQRKFVIGNVSRMTRDKGQQVIIEAAPKILKHIPNAYFLLIGNGPDKKYFESLIKKAKLEDYFLLPGFVDDLNKYFSIMDIFVFPTVWELEGFGLVIPEAMIREIPVIGSDFGPVREIIDDNKTGLRFEAGNSQKLADAALRISEDNTLRKQIIEAAYQKAIKLYDIHKVSDTIIDTLYDATI
jgi:glycosyltransferase involved in cell wall biosynthesis